MSLKSLRLEKCPTLLILECSERRHVRKRLERKARLFVDVTLSHPLSLPRGRRCRNNRFYLYGSLIHTTFARIFFLITRTILCSNFLTLGSGVSSVFLQYINFVSIFLDKKPSSRSPSLAKKQTKTKQDPCLTDLLLDRALGICFQQGPMPRELII